MSTHVDPCLALALRRADRVVSQLYNRHMEASGLKGTQYSVLRAIGDDGCVTARELSERLDMDQTTVSRALKPLLRDRLLEANPGLEDRREKLLCLTDQGRKVFLEAHQGWEAAQAELRKYLGKKTSSDMLAVARKVYDLSDKIAEK